MAKSKDLTWKEVLKALDPIRRKSPQYSAGVTHGITEGLRKICMGEVTSSISEREDALAMLERIKAEGESDG